MKRKADSELGEVIAISSNGGNQTNNIVISKSKKLKLTGAKPHSDIASDIPNQKSNSSSSALIKSRKGYGVMKIGRNKKLPKAKKIQHKIVSSSSRQQTSKVDWSKFKNEKKNLKKLRKEKKKETHFESIQGAKKLWEEMRKGNCPEHRKQELTEQLMNLFGGKMSQVMRSHDTTRVIQWIIKLGSEKIKEAVVNEILLDLLTFSQCKYASHTVKCILRHSNRNIRKKVINSFCSNIHKLLSSKYAVPLVEEAYSKFATKDERMKMKRNLYAAFYKSGNAEKSCLSDIFLENQDIKISVMNNMKSILDKLLDKPGTLKSSLVHEVLLDYISHCDEMRRKEVLEAVQLHVKSLTGSKDGCNVVRAVLWNASTKVKKVIVKELKQGLSNMAMSEYGSGVILSLIDSIDDTVLLKKAIIPGIIANAEDISKDRYGKKVLLYLVAHRDPRFFSSSEVCVLEEADKYTKKEVSVRMKELMDGVLDPLLAKIEENTSFWLHDGKMLLVTHAIINAAMLRNTNLSGIWNNIADYIIDEKSIFTEDRNTYSLIEHPGLHMVLKKIISLDQTRETKIEGTLSKILEEKITLDVLKKWITLNRGCYLLVSLMKVDGVNISLKKKLCTQEIGRLLNDQSTKGAILLKQMLVKSKNG